MRWYRNTGGFQCNAAGDGSETKIPATGHWCAIWVTAYASDVSGTWFTGEPSHPYLQNSANAVMGPVILQPGQPMETLVAGATANIQTTIEYRGWISDLNDGSDLTSVVGSEITAGSVSAAFSGPLPVIGAQTNLGSISVTAATTFTQNFTLPAGTIALWLLVTGNWAPNPGLGGTINVFGTMSTVTYAAFFPPKGSPFVPAPNNLGEPGVNYVEIGSGVDSVITINGEGPSVGTGLSITVVASPVTPLVGTDFKTINGTVLSPGQDPGAGGTSSLPIVPAEFYRPTPWQAPLTATPWPNNVPGGGSLTLVAAPASPFFLRIFQVVWLLSATASADFGQFQAGVSPMAQWSAAANDQTFHVFDFGGIALPVATALNVTANSTTNNFGGFITYTSTVF